MHVRTTSIQAALPTLSDYCNPLTLHTRSTNPLAARRTTRSPLLSQQQDPGRGGKAVVTKSKLMLRRILGVMRSGGE